VKDDATFEIISGWFSHTGQHWLVHNLDICSWNL